MIGRTDIGGGLAVVAFVTAACGAGEGDSTAARGIEPPAELRNEPSLQIDTAGAIGLSAQFRHAAGRALPAVVQVQVTARPGRVRRWPRSDERRTVNTGSGFIMDGDGHVLTNHHVVRDAERVSVRLADGREFGAGIVGADPSTDVAVLRLAETGGAELPFARFGDSDGLQVGDWVLALGNPLGLDFTVTAGIVSATGRSLGILADGIRSTHLEAFIQTDAAVNPGNSGGPLVDLLGRVVGINAAIESGTGYFTGAGFAIPINLVRRVAADLIQNGVVHRPRLGVTVQDVTEADAEVYGLPSIGGAEIASISPGLPADRAGLRMGDVVTRVDGVPVHGVTDFQLTLASHRPGETVELELIRFGTPLRRSVRLDQFEPGQALRVPAPEPASGSGLLGFMAEPLPRAILDAAGVPGEARLWIASVDPFGPARETVPAGVALISLNGQAVRSVSDLERIAASIQPGQAISVVVADPRLDRPAPTIYNYRVR